MPAALVLTVPASSATMVTAILPSLTDEADELARAPGLARPKPNPRLSAAYSVESEVTITPERYTRTLSSERGRAARPRKPSALAGLVGLFTGCGALVALALFLPLPARFGDMDGVTPGQAVSYSFYLVGAVALAVAVFVFFGLRGLAGEDAKGWALLLGNHGAGDEAKPVRRPNQAAASRAPVRAGH